MDIPEPSINDILQSYCVEEMAQARTHIEADLGGRPRLRAQETGPGGLTIEATMILRMVDGRRSYAELAEITGNRDEGLLVLADLRVVAMIEDELVTRAPTTSSGRGSAIARLTKSSKRSLKER